jgi:hypothetical protein
MAARDGAQSTEPMVLDKGGKREKVHGWLSKVLEHQHGSILIFVLLRRGLSLCFFSLRFLLLTFFAPRSPF